MQGLQGKNKTLATMREMWEWPRDFEPKCKVPSFFGLSYALDLLSAHIPCGSLRTFHVASWAPGYESCPASHEFRV